MKRRPFVQLTALLLLLCLAFSLAACGQPSWYYDYGDPARGFDTDLFYRNDHSLSGADPFVLVADGYYYLYITGNTYIPAYRSKNLNDWEELGPVFTPARDAWSIHNLWAPEVVERDGT